MVHIPLPVESDRLKTFALMVTVALSLGVVAGVEHVSSVPKTDRASSRQAASLAPPPQAVTTPALHAAITPGPVDIGFAQDMSLHHEQALTMARMALGKGSPRVRQLAQGIVDQQLKETGTLQGWLMLWQAPDMAASDDMRWMRDAYLHTPRREPDYERFIDRCRQGRGMPGMAIDPELAALWASPNAQAFDARFLALMARHHQGAITMARFAAEYAALEAVRGVARAMAAEQQQEMVWMLSWLKAP